MTNKYRVWAKERNHPQNYSMIPDKKGSFLRDSVELRPDGQVIRTVHYGMGESDSDDITKDAIIMFFTGLLDKTGNEIYDGDICEIRYNNGTPTVTGQVKWHQYHTGYSIHSKRDIPHSLNFSGSVVDGVYVIGNIHEDKHLL
jgi:uncharacterized phage protein (TIGR01671 family)